MRAFILALVFSVLGCSNNGCGGSQSRSSAIGQAELRCAAELAARLAAASQQGSASKTVTIELAAEELPCVLAALGAKPQPEGSGKLPGQTP